MQTFTKEFIASTFLTSTNKISAQKIKQVDPTLASYIVGSVNASSLNEAIYLIYNNLATPPICNCGNKLALKSFSAGYREYCSCKCAGNTSATKQKRKDTCTQKYGVSNASQSQQAKQKAVSTNLAKFGVSYPMASSEVVSKRNNTNQRKYGGNAPMSDDSIKLKVRDTNIELYGGPAPMCDRAIYEKSRLSQIANWFPTKIKALAPFVTPNFTIDDYDNVDNLYPWTCSICSTEFSSKLDDGRIPKCPKCYPHIQSKPEQEVAEFVESLGLAVDRHNKRILVRKGKHPLELDIVIESKKVAIEFNGLYSHSHHSKSYHLTKTEMAEKAGYQLIHIFEDEWRDKRQIVESRIKSVLGLNPRIFARKCKLVEVTRTVAKNFFDVYHIQGHVNSSYCIGLELEGELVAVMSFGKPRFNKNFDWELLRYASINNVVGGASKLFAHFRTLHAGSIITYCDRRYGTGKLYEKLGYTYIGSSKPSFAYTDKFNRFNRMQFQKHKLKGLLQKFDPAMSSEDNMLLNGYRRIYDCGNLIFAMPAKS